MLGSTHKPKDCHAFALSLRQHKSAIIELWQTRIRNDTQTPTANTLNKPQLLDHVPKFIDELQRLLVEGEATTKRESGNDQFGDFSSDTPHNHAEQRAMQGYSLTEALRELSHLRAAINFCCGQNLTQKCGALFHAIIDKAMANVAEKIFQHLINQSSEQHAFLTEVFRLMPAGAIVAEAPAGKLIMHNQEAERILGHSLKNMTMQDDYKKFGAIHDDGSSYRPEEYPIIRALTNRSPILLEPMLYKSRDGKLKQFAVSAAPVLRSDGEILASVCIFADVSQQKSLERDLQRAKEIAESASKAKSEFLANMSHEIRTPLSAIVGFADLMLEPDLSELERHTFVSSIKRNGEVLINLINDILDLSKIEADSLDIELSRFLISDVLDEITMLFLPTIKQKGIALTIASRGLVPLYIQTDSTRLRQILVNIIGNAIKFTNQGGVTVWVELQDHGKAPELVFTVTDTGTGIPIEQQAQLFQVFRQANQGISRKYGGSGLGLALSRRLARALGGDVSLQDSQLGHGSTFEIRIDPGQVSACPMIRLPQNSGPESSPQHTR